ncbi:hypothetical protein ACT3XG_05125 [Paenibacillus polymyxa]|uniref:hypothetical protein n=1 Tax=Paenibacillus TaxID=44249 RepID=UPI0005ECB807|nr:MULTISPECIES: hypothetical protein [Paenibacillus]AUS25274.1 hypothetical protein C1A50_1089 [Paenibacillus polymyxa]KAF6658034.1 hypothetical protein HFD99_07960 [Paenibacillus sp. EKM301P]KJK32010.1 hypothetical protein TY89_05470 [Paenibacillus polymyxa]MEE4577596.1 hypothetical protein [Paenibacillus polymyxa]QDA25993.1 hypothetical protein FGY93_02895 [Paenibacillus polymyxa]
MGHMDEQIVAMIHAARKEQQDASGLPKSDLHHDMESESSLELEKGEMELHPLMMLDGERIAFAERPLLNDKISMWLPRTFTEMGEREIELKYPSSYRPPVILTDPTGEINFSFNLTASELADEELETFISEMVYILHHTQKLTEWYGDGMCEVYGHRLGYCEFMTPVLNSRLYNLTFFAVLEGHVLICSFNCTEEHMDTWRLVAQRMMSTLKILPSKAKGEETWSK